MAVTVRVEMRVVPVEVGLLVLTEMAVTVLVEAYKTVEMAQNLVVEVVPRVPQPIIGLDQGAVRGAVAESPLMGVTLRLSWGELPLM
jgi:hypothetical protein